MLAQHFRWWANNKPALLQLSRPDWPNIVSASGQCIEVAGYVFSVVLCGKTTTPHTGEFLNKRVCGHKTLTQCCLKVGTASSAANIKTSLDQQFLLVGIVGSWTVELLTSYSKANLYSSSPSSLTNNAKYGTGLL